MRRLASVVSVLVLLLGSAWAVLALKLTGVGPQGTPALRYVLAVGLLGAVGAAWRWRSRNVALAVLAVGVRGGVRVGGLGEAVHVARLVAGPGPRIPCPGGGTARHHS